MRSHPNLQYYFWSIIDVLFPPRCAGCGREGTRWCPVCQAETETIGEPICPSCGRPGNKGELCRECRQHPREYSACRSWGLHTGPLREAVHKLKYHRDLGLGAVMAKNIVQVVKDNQWEIDLVTAVPLGQKRRKERGYNQAELLARPTAWELDAAYLPRSIRRTRETQSQVNLNRKQRLENVAGAFWADPKAMRDKRVLMVDDVLTTGATVNAAAASARQAGAVAIYAVTLARAVGEF